MYFIIYLNNYIFIYLIYIQLPLLLPISNAIQLLVFIGILRSREYLFTSEFSLYRLNHKSSRGILITHLCIEFNISSHLNKFHHERNTLAPDYNIYESFPGRFVTEISPFLPNTTSQLLAM